MDHIGLVKRVALHLKTRLPNFMELEELIQVGTIGLIEARKLNDDVQALVDLEKAKYHEVLERQNDLLERQKGPDFVKVPRNPNMIFFSRSSE